MCSMPTRSPVPNVCPAKNRLRLGYGLHSVPRGSRILLALIRRRRQRPIPEPAPQDWALERLTQLSSRNGDGAATAAELAAIIRGFLRRRYGVAECLTTEELAALRPFSNDLSDWLQLLERCDLTKFARIEFTPVETAETIRRAQTLPTASLPISEASPTTKSGEFR